MDRSPSVTLHRLLDWLYASEEGVAACRRLEQGRLSEALSKLPKTPGEAWTLLRKSHRWDPDFEEGVARVLAKMVELGDGYAANDGERVVPGEARRGRMAAAIVTVLEGLADDRASISADRVRRRYGAEAAAIVAEAARAEGGPMRAGPLPLNPKGKWACFTDARVAHRVARSAEGALADRMPALDWVERTFGEGRPLEKVRVLAIQHLFPSTVPLLEAIARAGCRKIQVLGKAYSTDSDVVRRLAAMGIDVVESGSEGEDVVLPNGSANVFTRPGSPFIGGAVRSSREAFIRDWLERQLGELEDDEKLLLLDDGGYLVECLQQYFPDQVHRAVAVEQTQNGKNRIEALRARLRADGRDLGCPVVDLAGHDLKKRFESPMIGESVADFIERWLSSIFPRGVTRTKEATVIGFGAVGRAVAAALSRLGYRVFVYDTESDPAWLEEASSLGYVPCASKADALARGHLVVSCVGAVDGEVLSLNDYEHLPDGAVVANAASGHKEVSAHLEAFWAAASRGDIDDRGLFFADFCGEKVTLGDADGRDDTRTHVIYRTRDGKSALVLCSGHVVNMAADIPPEYIQLTRAALLLAVFQAASAHVPGFIALRDDGTEGILRETKACLARHGLTLLEPRFDLLRPVDDFAAHRGDNGTIDQGGREPSRVTRHPRGMHRPRPLADLMARARAVASRRGLSLLGAGLLTLSDRRDVRRFARAWLSMGADEYASEALQLDAFEVAVEGLLHASFAHREPTRASHPSDVALAWAAAWVELSARRLPRSLDALAKEGLTWSDDDSARRTFGALVHPAEIRAVGERYVLDNPEFGLQNLRHAVRQAEREGYPWSGTFHWIHPGTAPSWRSLLRELELSVGGTGVTHRTRVTPRG